MTHPLQAARRGWFLLLLGTVALACAFATVTIGTEHDAAAAAGHTHAQLADTGTAATSPTSSRAALAFHDQMRKLWEDHITWTRLAIVDFASGSGGFSATAARLLANQSDIGDAIKPFYGEEAGNQLTALLDDHINLAVQLLQAAKAGDTAAFDQAQAQWYANANEIADFLAAANLRFWPQQAMRDAMREHLDQTLAEASHELGGQYAASVADYEEIHHHILEMADLLSAGIIRTFPQRFRPSSG